MSKVFFETSLFNDEMTIHLLVAIAHRVFFSTSAQLAAPAALLMVRRRGAGKLPRPCGKHGAADDCPGEHPPGGVHRRARGRACGP